METSGDTNLIVAELHSEQRQSMWPVAVTALWLWAAADPFAGARERMVREQIEARGVRDEAVLRAMRQAAFPRAFRAGWTAGTGVRRYAVADRARGHDFATIHRCADDGITGCRLAR